MKKISLLLILLLSTFLLIACGKEETFFDQYDYKVTQTLKMGSEKYQYQYVYDYTIQIKPKENYNNPENFIVKITIYDGEADDSFSELIAIKYYSISSNTTINDVVSDVYVNNFSLTPYEIEIVEKEESDYIKDFNLEKISVSFDSNGGNLVENQEIPKGGRINKPSDPEKDGYVFLGWYLENDKFNFNDALNENIVLVAKWQRVQLSVLTNKNFTDNFILSISKTYYKTFNGFDNAVFYDIFITKKSNFIITNTFILNVKVVTNSGLTYINENIKVSDFDKSGKVTFGPTSFKEGLDFSIHNITISVTNVG